MASQFKLFDTQNYVLPYINFYPIKLGSSQQPFLGMCNAVAMVMVAPPFRFNWNRASINFITTAGVQTYMHAGSWAANTAYALNTVIIDSNGFGQKVIVAETSGTVTPVFSQGIFTTTTESGSPPLGVQWQNIGLLSNIAQITDFGYIEKATIQDVNNNSVWKEMAISLDLSRDGSATSCPKYVSAQADDNLGDVALRVTPPPGSAYPISVEYQKLWVPFSTVSSNWSPIPDRLFEVYSMGVLALALFYKGDSRFQWASQQFVARMLANYEGLSETQINQFRRTWEGTLTESVFSAKANQGNQARGI